MHGEGLEDICSLRLDRRVSLLLQCVSLIGILDSDGLMYPIRGVCSILDMYHVLLLFCHLLLLLLGVDVAYNLDLLKMVLRGLIVRGYRGLADRQDSIMGLLLFHYVLCQVGHGCELLV